MNFKLIFYTSIITSQGVFKNFILISALRGIYFMLLNSFLFQMSAKVKKTAVAADASNFIHLIT